MKTQRVTLITLGVDDLDRAKAFYGALGWSPAETQEGVAFYQLNGLVLGLFGRAALADDQGRPGAALGTGAMTLAQNFSTEAEVDAAFEAALAVGATALKKPEKVFWGGYSGYWADPDGHVWEVAMNPFWPLASTTTRAATSRRFPSAPSRRMPAVLPPSSSRSTTLPGCSTRTPCSAAWASNSASNRPRSTCQV